MISHLLRWFPCLPLFFYTSVQAACYESAAARYGVPEVLLRAIAKVESGGLDAAKALNRNKDGTTDIGRMQINSGWLGTLARYGITAEHLKDECTSINVGAWILSMNVERLGLSWDAVGAYNVGCKKLTEAECSRRRNRYAWKVYRAFNSQSEKHAEARPAPVAKATEKKDRVTTIATVSFD